MRLAIRDLDVRFGDRQVVGIDELSLDPGQILGRARQRGPGTSLPSPGLPGRTPTVGPTARGSIPLDGTELTSLSQRDLREVRGRRIAAIFQSPSMSFNPVFRVGSVVHGALRLHGMTRG